MIHGGLSGSFKERGSTVEVTPAGQQRRKHQGQNQRFLVVEPIE